MESPRLKRGKQMEAPLPGSNAHHLCTKYTYGRVRPRLVVPAMFRQRTVPIAGAKWKISRQRKTTMGGSGQVRGICASLVCFWLSKRIAGVIISSEDELPPTKLIPDRPDQIPFVAPPYLEHEMRFVWRPSALSFSQTSYSWDALRKSSLEQEARHRRSTDVPARTAKERLNLREREQVLRQQRQRLDQVTNEALDDLARGLKTSATKEQEARTLGLPLLERLVQERKGLQAWEKRIVQSSQRKQSKLFNEERKLSLLKERAARLAADDDAMLAAYEGEARQPRDRLMELFGVRNVSTTEFRHRWYSGKRGSLKEAMQIAIKNPGYYYMSVRGEGAHALGIVTKDMPQFFDPNTGIITFEACEELRDWLPEYIVAKYPELLVELGLYAVDAEN